MKKLLIVFAVVLSVFAMVAAASTVSADVCEVEVDVLPVFVTFEIPVDVEILARTNKTPLTVRFPIACEE